MFRVNIKFIELHIEFAAYNQSAFWRESRHTQQRVGILFEVLAVFCTSVSNKMSDNFLMCIIFMRASLSYNREITFISCLWLNKVNCLIKYDMTPQEKKIIFRGIVNWWIGDLIQSTDKFEQMSLKSRGLFDSCVTKHFFCTTLVFLQHTCAATMSNLELRGATRGQHGNASNN